MRHFSTKVQMCWYNLLGSYPSSFSGQEVPSNLSFPPQEVSSILFYIWTHLFRVGMASPMLIRYHYHCLYLLIITQFLLHRRSLYIHRKSYPTQIGRHEIITFIIYHILVLRYMHHIVLHCNLIIMHTKDTKFCSIGRLILASTFNMSLLPCCERLNVQHSVVKNLRSFVTDALSS